MKKKILSIIFAATIGLCGCDSWLTIQPETLITPEDLYKSPKGFKDALIGCYQLMERNYSYNGEMTTGTLEHLACSWYVTQNSDEEKLNLHEYTDEEVDKKLANIFQSFYKNIANVSELIKAINHNDGVLTQIQHDQYLGEALGLRAFLHLELMRIWGPMPGKVNVSKKYLPFVEQMQIEPYEYLTYDAYMEKVANDLNQAETLLAKRESNLSEPEKQYINYYAILALQARFHFWMGNHEKAMEYGNKLLQPENLSHFPLKDLNITDAKEALKNETIWHYAFSSSTSVSLSTWYNYKSYILSELFENQGGDSRINFWGNDYNTEEGVRVFLTKYDVKKENPLDPEEEVVGEVPMIRISEIYLMMIELSELDAANKLYREFCTARNLPVIDATSKGELIQRLKLEYRREFLGEGQLFYHYKRYGTLEMPRCERGCGEDAYVLPIPKKEFDL